MRGIFKQQTALDPGTVATDFEVRCDRCDVSYPVGTKRCMYCGGRPGHRPMFARQIAFDPQGDIEVLDSPFEPDDPVRTSETPFELATPFEEEKPEKGRGSIFRLFGNLSWVILFALLTLYRACTG